MSFADKEAEIEYCKIHREAIRRAKSKMPGLRSFSHQEIKEHCKICEKNRKEYDKAYHKLHKEKLNARRLQREFGISLEDYDTMFENQNGACAICGKSETVKNQSGVIRLSIDHDHKTNEVRGLLCQKCNSMLGYAQDNISILLNAGIYLEKYKPA